MKKLAIIGASYLQLPLVKKAKQMGIETHCFAWMEGAVCKDECDFFYEISILEKERILEQCREIGIDGITTIASDVAVPTVCYIAYKMSLVGNDYTDSPAFTNKHLMRQLFKEKNVSSPKFLKITHAQEISQIDLVFPVIVKPTDRSGSKGVQKVETADALLPAIKRAISESIAKEAIVEEFISGPEVSVETISWKGVHYILAITDKVTTNEPYFVEIEHHQPTNLVPEIQEQIKLETIKALRALNINFGASHAEFKITTQNKIITIEVGARMGGDFIGSDLVYLSCGYDFLQATIDVALGKFHQPSFLNQKHSGIFFLSAETPHIEAIINSNTMKEIVTSEITSTVLKQLTCSGDRSGYLIYQSDRRLSI